MFFNYFSSVISYFHDFFMICGYQSFNGGS
jgi:hypothetical protein